MDEIKCCVKGCSNELKCSSRTSWNHVKSKNPLKNVFNKPMSVRVQCPKVCHKYFETKICSIKKRSRMVSSNAETARFAGKSRNDAEWKSKEKIMNKVSRYDVLEEHNYFINKKRVLELQEAVAEAGRSYKSLQAQVHHCGRLLNAKNQRISELQSKHLAQNVKEERPTFVNLINWKDILEIPNILMWHTGFDSLEKFHRLVDFLRPAYETMMETHHHRRRLFRKMSLSIRTQLFIVLSRFRLRCVDKSFLTIFGISFTFHNLLWEFWIILLHRQFRRLPLWPQKKPNEPTFVMLDSVKIFTKHICAEEFSNPIGEANKALIGVSPDGCICFVSDLYDKEDISDYEITEKSGIVQYLDSGDWIFADEGFSIGELLERKNVTLISTNTDWFFEEDGHRIVERVIRNIKSYEILEIANFCNTQIWTICCYLVNFNHDAFQAKTR